MTITLEALEGKIAYIIEDDSFLGKVLLDKALKANMNAELFINAEDGIAAMRSKVPHVLLLDIFLPSMNGLDALELIRGDEKIKHVPVIVVSNNDDAKDRDRALDLGAKFLIKAASSPDEIFEHIADTFK